MASSEVPAPATSPEVPAPVASTSKETHPTGSEKAKALRAHKGHRNLFIRGFCTLCQMAVSLMSLKIPKEQMLVVAIVQFFSAMTLFVQWRTGSPWMFVGRAITSWLIMLLDIHTSVCGNNWPWEFGVECTREAWDEPLLAPLRFFHLMSSVRMLLNGLSLYLQFLYPTRMFCHHGHEQLFWRGWIQASGVIVHFSRYLIKRIRLDATGFEKKSLEEQTHWFRIIVILVSAGSLWNQWWLTGKGHTGHPLSDAYERLRRDGSSLSSALSGMHSKANDLRHRAAEAVKHAEETAKAEVHVAADQVHHCTHHEQTV